MFVGGWTVEAAEAVCAVENDLPLDVLDRLQSLVDKSLIRQVAGVDGEPRFTMLETIREYAHERLQASGEAERVAQRHAAYFLDVVAAIEPLVGMAHPVPSMGRLEIEHDNLRAALQWARAEGRVELLARLGAHLWWFWWLHSHLSEGREWLDLALTARDALPAALRAQVLFGAGVLAWVQGDYARAITVAEESLQLYRELGDRHSIATALAHLGRVALYRGDLQQAKLCAEESLAVCRELGDTAAIATLLTDLAHLALFEGDHQRATALSAESLALFQALDHDMGMALARTILGLAVLAQADYARAAHLLVESLRQWQHIGTEVYVAYALVGCAAVALGTQEHTAAASAAVRLCAAAGASLDARGVTMPAPGAAGYDRLVTLARSRLDPAAFATAWAEGRAMTLAEAMVYADEVATRSLSS